MSYPDTLFSEGLELLKKCSKNKPVLSLLSRGAVNTQKRRMLYIQLRTLAERLLIIEDEQKQIEEKKKPQQMTYRDWWQKMSQLEV